MKSWQEKVICEICGLEISKCALSSHLKWSHNGMTYKEYFDKYIEPFEHICPYCGKELKWFGKAGRHYGKTCGSKECHSKYVSEHNQGGTPESIEKIKKTKYERYGDENYQNVEKIKQTCLKRYGEDNVWKVKSIRRKCIDTLEKRTGKRTSSCGNYAVYYNGLKFDSKTEACFYFWCIENGKNIIFCNKSFQYFVDGVEHTYVPDFIVDDEIIEIKGEHLIDSEGYLLDFSCQKRLVEKTQCLRDNNVKIIMHQEVIDKYKPSNYEDILNNSKSLRNKEDIEFPKCPYCGKNVKIRKNNPLTFTKTCCSKECINKIRNIERDVNSGQYLKRKKDDK